MPSVFGTLVVLVSQLAENANEIFSTLWEDKCDVNKLQFKIMLVHETFEPSQGWDICLSFFSHPR